MLILIIDAATGVIVRQVRPPTGLEPGQDWRVLRQEDFVDDERLLYDLAAEGLGEKRMPAADKTAIAADGTDAATFDVPAGTRVTHNGKFLGALQEPGFVFATNEPGLHRLVFSTPPDWRNGDITIEAAA